jgi:site-specific recombinase XerC
MAEHKTDFQIRQILKYNRDGSPDRQTARHQNLMRCVEQLQARGYSKRWDVHKIGKREATRLVHDWREQGLAPRTIANRLVDIRWLADKVGRESEIPSNKDLGLPLRKNTEGYGQSKSVAPDWGKIASLDERMALITELRVEFGLRTEEALKFQHKVATKTPDQVTLKGSWCKGGRPREIPITNDRQRDLLERVASFQTAQGDRSMIPGDQRYRTFYAAYNAARHAAGVSGHEYRHHWAQQRFQAVSEGIAAPHAGGPAYAELTPQEQARWNRAAAVVNQELGHGEGRQDITSTYIGSRFQ